MIGEPFFKLQDKSSCVVVELTSNQTGAEGVSGGGSVDKEDEVDKTAVPSTNCSTSSTTHPLQPKAVPLAITFHFNLDHPDASNNTDHSFTSNRYFHDQTSNLVSSTLIFDTAQETCFQD